MATSGAARRRLTQARVDEFHQALGEVRAELAELRDRLDQRDAAGLLLAEEIGKASLRVLRAPPQTTTPATRRDGGQRR